MVDNMEYEKLQESVKHCVLRGQYIEALAKINDILDTDFLSDSEFIKQHRKINLHPASGIVTGLLIGLVFISPILMSFSLLFVDGSSQATPIFLLFFLIGMGLGVIICRAIAKARVDSKGRKKLKQYAATRDSIISEIPNFKKRQVEYTKNLTELVTLMKDRNNCIIPSKYWDYAPALISYIDDCRAHDLESAINVLEVDLHHKAMEEKQFEILMEQREARILSEIAAENSIAAREAAELAEINSAETLSELRWKEFIDSFDS